MTAHPQHAPSESTQPPPSVLRRHALAGVAAFGVGVPLLAACGADEASTTATDSGGDSASPSTSSSPSEAESSAAGGADALTTAADVPEGGGTIFADQKVVVCQPSAGDFTCFTAVCTHQGCIVSSVEGSEIVCGCHNSRFSIEDGSPISGPASSPLEAVEITVDGDSISLA